MLTVEQRTLLANQKEESENSAEGNFVDSYELALFFFSDPSTLPTDLQGSTPKEIKDRLNSFTFEETTEIINGLAPMTGLSNEQIFSWIWIRGARDINNGKGASADFIRDYTQDQIDFRSKKTIPTEEEIQKISNEIARNLIEDLIQNGELPPIIDVGLNDALVVTNEAANGDPAAWAGNPLFVLLGSDIFFRANLLHDSSAQQELRDRNPDFPIADIEPADDTYDLLLAFKLTADLADGRDFISNGIDAFVTQSNGFLENAYGEDFTGLYISKLDSPDPVDRFSGLFPSLVTNLVQVEVDDLDSNNSELKSPKIGIVHGADGDDIIIGRSIEIDVLPINLAFLDGGSGIDTADYSKITRKLTVNIDKLDETTEAEYIGSVRYYSDPTDFRTEKLYNIENIVGSLQNDEFQIETFSSPLQEVDAGDGEEDLLDLSETNNSVTVNLPAETLSSGENSLTINNFELFEGTVEDDTFIADDRTASIDGGDGEDTADFSNLSSGVELNLNPEFFASKTDVSLKGIERVIGTAQNDRIRGSREEEIFEGGMGNDQLEGGDGDDIAVFSDVFENYNYDPDTNSFTHARGTQTDGIDTLISIEFAQFSDRLIPLPLEDSSKATETAVILNSSDDNNGETFNAVFGTTEEDTLEAGLDFDKSNNLVFAGDADDLVDLSQGEGNNRVYGSNGNDTFILGTGDRIVGGEGMDSFFTVSGGDNTISGNEGADQFWIADAEIPDAVNTITDFERDLDVIGIAGLGIGFEDVEITQQEENVLISANGSNLAILQDIQAESLNIDNFDFV